MLLDTIRTGILGVVLLRHKIRTGILGFRGFWGLDFLNISHGMQSEMLKD